MASGADCTVSRMSFLVCSVSPAPHRYSIRILRSVFQPRSASALRKASIRAWPALSLSVYDPSSTPMRRIWLLCCPRAACGHTETLPTEMMNSRRLMVAPVSRNQPSYRIRQQRRKGEMSELGHYLPRRLKFPASASPPKVAAAVGDRRGAHFPAIAGQCASRMGFASLYPSHGYGLANLFE